ncbi:MAG: hypothetical protein ACW972_11745 [Promethearchaeota archaeon]|jgi:hypothetical protein
MAKHYKNQQLMKFLVIIGALVGLIYIISGIASLAGYGFVPVFIPSIVPLQLVVTLIIGLVVVVLTLLVGIRPNEPLPFHWLVLFILAILLAIFGAGILAAVLVVIAAIIGLIEDL